MNQGPIWGRLLKKTRGRQSRATVPLTSSDAATCSSINFATESLFTLSHLTEFSPCLPPLHKTHLPARPVAPPPPNLGANYPTTPRQPRGGPRRF